MEKRKKWLMLIAIIFMLPCLWLTSSCGGTDTDNLEKKVPCTVIFYTGIATEFNLDRIEVMSGSTIEKPRNFPERYYDESTDTEYQFIGWYSDQERTKLWKFETDKVQSSMTLFALWEEI